MGEREQRLEEKGYKVGYPAPRPDAIIDPFAIDGKTMYVSGHVSIDVLDPNRKFIGKVPSQVSVEDAVKSAELCAANLLRAVHLGLGSLDRVDRVLRITGYVNADPTFTDEHVVINGATGLIRHVLGDAGKHARSALGMGQLPLGVATEVEMIVRIK